MLPRIVHQNEIDLYIAGFPGNTQLRLRQLRTVILKTIPGAEELISYKMPAYKYHGMLVWFAAYKNHVGFYPTSSGIRAFNKEIAIFKNSKGAVQFPLDKPLPVTLIKKILKYRARENQEKAKLKTKK